MTNKPIFFDASGKRRKIINILLSLSILLIVSALLFIGFYIVKLNKINSIVETKEQKPVSALSNTTLLYTDNHPKAYSIVSDRIEKIDTLILPKYLATSSTISTPPSYQSYIKDINFIGNNKPVHYKRFFMLSSKDYLQQPTDREANTTVTSKVDAQFPSLISTTQMLTIRDDLLSNKAEGLYIDLDLAVIKNKTVADQYIVWFDSFKALLQDKNLQLGLIVQPSTFNTYNSPLLHEADMLYISFNSSNSVAKQIDQIKSIWPMMPKNITYEIPTISREQNMRRINSYIKSVDYVTAQNLIIDTKIDTRSTEPIVHKSGYTSTSINDAITANNIAIKLKSEKLIAGQTQYAIANPGFEEYTTWKLLENPYEEIRNNYLLSQNLIASLDIKTVGEGKIYTIDQFAKYGNRKIELSSDNSITSSKVEKPNDIAVVKASGKKPKQIAITFDDGPHQTETEKVLDILDRYHVKGTFFMVGKNVIAHPDVVKSVVARGHEVENHTYDHPVFSKLTQQSQINQIKATSELLKEISGQPVHFFRKPYSDNNTINTQEDLQYLKELKSLGLEASEYDIDSKDWLLDNGNQVVAKVKNDIENSKGDYSQILFHDAHTGIDQTLDALPKIIEYIQSQGIEIVRVDQLGNKKTNFTASTTQTYRAIDWKNRMFTLIIWINILFICFALFRYALMIFGAIAYNIKHRLTSFFFNKIDNSQRRNPKLTIIIACYNEELVIGRTIQSLLDSSYKNFTIVVVNDGSTDKTENVVKEFCSKDKRVKLITKPNAGKAAALQVGIKYTQNPWLVFCDADTIFDANALHNFTNTIFTNKNIGAVAGRITVGNDINALTRSQVLEYGVSHLFTKAAQDILNTITVVPGASGLWSRTALQKVNGFDHDTLAEDADATLKVIGMGKRVKYNSTVTAKTEAPSDLKMLYKQRTRWQLGNMQAIIKHKKGLFNRRYGNLGFVGLPMFYIEILTTIFYPLLMSFSILVILAKIFSWTAILPTNLGFVSSKIFILFSLSLILIELCLSIFVILFERKSIKSKLLLLCTLPYYLLYYKSFLSIATIASLLRAFRGTFHGWGHLKRTATVK